MQQADSSFDMLPPTKIHPLDRFLVFDSVDVCQSTLINVHQEVLVKTAKNMVNRIAISKARVNCAVVKRAHLNGEYFILEKDGIPIAWQDWYGRRTRGLSRAT